jgi:hypothetical protein
MTLLKNVLAKLFLGLLAFSSATWAAFFLYNSDPSVRMNNMANGILSGAGFKQFPLSESGLLTAAEDRAICNPLEVRAAAIIRLRLFEAATDAADSHLADLRLKALRSSVNAALRCSPADGFLWFIAYWCAINQGGAVSEHLGELRRSYLLAPYEGWIALRSPYVLAIYDILPADLQESARNEFVSIVRTGLIRNAVNILKGSGWRHRDALLGGLATVRVELRLRLDRALRAEDIIANIPGVEPREFRPWRY